MKGRTPAQEGVDVAHAAMQLLDLANAPSDQEHGWTLEQATNQLAHITASSEVWKTAVAYLACQYHGSHQVNGEAERLALFQIRTALKSLDEKRS